MDSVPLLARKQCWGVREYLSPGNVTKGRSLIVSLTTIEVLSGHFPAWVSFAGAHWLLASGGILQLTSRAASHI